MTAAQVPPDSQTRGRVLVVEDDAHIRDLVVLHLQLEGLTAVAAGDGAAGLRLAKADPFDLLILDVMLPEIDGITVCRAVRRESMNGDVPILMLTARREEADKVLGLESGADDYLTKPFGVREFIARVRALLRRRPSRAPRTRGGNRCRWFDRRSRAPPCAHRRTARSSSPHTNSTCFICSRAIAASCSAAMR